MQAHSATSVPLLGGAARVANGRVEVENESALKSELMDGMVREAVFGNEAERAHARWLIWELGQAVGVRPSSINDLYLARGRGEVSGFTVPAINVRGMAYDTARAIFRTANRLRAGAFLLEIARSEIAYTDQRPAEYVSVMLAAALREGFRGPVFIQGDHFQVNAKKFASDAITEVNAVKQLAREAIAAGFYNIDVDTSTLVDLSKATLEEQQRVNYESAVDIALYIRDMEPEGVTISVGGEIGEVGTQNSTVEELRAFMDGFSRTLANRAAGERSGRGAGGRGRGRGRGRRGEGEEGGSGSGETREEGLSKISVQSGTSHGGVVLADGSMAEVKIDLATLETLSRVAREEYGLAGAVQHGASTLPDDAFNNFPRTETAEIHLATNFQNMLYDHLPPALRAEIYDWLGDNAKDERRVKDSDEQFFYKTRKKALGPFKRRLWDLPDEVKRTLGRAYDEKFTFLFTQLGVAESASAVAMHVRSVAQHHTAPDVSAPDDATLSD